MPELMPDFDATQTDLKPICTAMALKNSSKRLVELRAIIRNLSLYRDEEDAADIGAYEGILTTIENKCKEKKSFRALIFLLTLQWAHEAPPPGPLYHSMIDGIIRLPHYHSDMMFKGFVVKSMSTLMPLVGKSQNATNLLTPILAVMGQEGYPQIKKNFFGGGGAKKAFDTSIKLWQDVFSAMRTLKYMPERDQLKLLWAAAASPDSIVLARHATHLMISMAAQSNNEAFAALLLDRFKSENGNLGRIFHMHDLLCRCYVMKLLATFANNEPAASITSLKELYTCVYKFIEKVDGLKQAKCVCDCIQYFVETRRSVSLQQAFSTASANNVFNIVTTALGLQLDRLNIDEHASSLSMIFRACIRMGKYHLRKSTDNEVLPGALALESSNVRDYYKVTELCKLLTVKVKVLSKSYRPDLLTDALVALLWLCPTTTSDAFFWEYLERHSLSAITQSGEDLCMHILDNLFERLRQEEYHFKTHSTLFTIAHSVVAIFPSPRSCQAVHNLWSWSSGILRSFSPILSDGAAKRSCHALLIQSLMLVIGRRLRVAVYEGSEKQCGGVQKPGYMLDLKRYGSWLLANHTFHWVVKQDESQEGLYNRRYLHLASIDAPNEDTKRDVTYEMPSLATMTEAVVLLMKLQEEAFCGDTELAKVALRLLVDDRTGVQPYFHSIRAFLVQSLGIESASQEVVTLALVNSLTHFGITFQDQAYDSLHAYLDSTWMSQNVFERAETQARIAKDEDKRKLEQRLREEREAHEKAAIEYRTFKVEGQPQHKSQPPRVEQELQHEPGVEAQKNEEQEKQEEEEKKPSVVESGVLEGELSSLEKAGVHSQQKHQSAPTPTLTQGEAEPIHGESPVVAPFIIPADASAGDKNDWIPTAYERREITYWFDSLDVEGGQHTNRVAATKVVHFLSSSKDYLGTRCIGLEQLRALWYLVDTQASGFVNRAQFFVFMRLLMLACSGKRPSMQDYYATYADQQIPLPPFGDELKKNKSKQRTDTASVWQPPAIEGAMIGEWYNRVNIISLERGVNGDNRRVIIALLETGGVHTGVLKQIWALVGLEGQKNVSLQKFTLLVRMTSLFLVGYQPSIESYRATVSDASITLPPVSFEMLKLPAMTTTAP